MKTERERERERETKKGERLLLVPIDTKMHICWHRSLNVHEYSAFHHLRFLFFIPNKFGSLFIMTKSLTAP